MSTTPDVAHQTQGVAGNGVRMPTPAPSVYTAVCRGYKLYYPMLRVKVRFTASWYTDGLLLTALCGFLLARA